jgi:hypothetical protein
LLPEEQRQRIVSEQNPGVMLNVEKVVRHLQELRAASYSVLNELLVRDVCILPTILDLVESKNDSSCSESLNQESFELMANLMSMTELRGAFETVGATMEKLGELK